MHAGRLFLIVALLLPSVLVFTLTMYVLHDYSISTSVQTVDRDVLQVLGHA